MKKIVLIITLLLGLFNSNVAMAGNKSNIIYLSRNKFVKGYNFSIEKSSYLGNVYGIESFNKPIIHIDSDTLNYSFEDVVMLSKLVITDSSYFEYWFRVFVDTSMANKTIGLLFLYTEPLNIFWDNKLIGNAGSFDLKKKKAINEKTDNFAFPFYTGKAGFHNLLVKQYRTKKDFKNAFSISYINLFLVNEYNNYIRQIKKDEYSMSTIFMEDGFRFFLLCVFVISLLFYFIVKRDKTFFWYCLLCFCILVVSFANFFEYNFEIDNKIIGSSILILISSAIFSFLAFIFQHFEGKIPKRVYYYSLVLPLFIIALMLMNYFNIKLGRFFDRIITPLFFIFLTIIIVEIISQLISAIRKKKKRVLFIAIGVLQFLVLYPILQFFTEFDNWDLVKIASLYYVPISFLITVIYIIKDSFTDNIAKQAEVLTLTQVNEKILQEQNIVLEQKVIERTAEVVEEKKLVEEKNREILDSIEYAKRIQNTILPPQKIVTQYLEQSFILYLPKDIVAGDFYWMSAPPSLAKGEEQVSPNSNDNIIKLGSAEKSPLRGSPKLEETEIERLQVLPFGEDLGGAILFAACDCTGHGVPGAMVSVVCSNALNKAVKEFGLTEPAKILDKVAELVIEDLSKNNDDNDELKDGMDASLCSLNVETGALQWAGANNALFIIKSAKGKMQSENQFELSTLNFELNEVKPDKQPIGKFDNPKPFTNHTIQLQKGDTIYLFTDGYADQFGGPKGKKYSKGKFKELLLSIQHLPMIEQREALYNAHIEWRNTQEQVDDICVIGVRV